MSSTSVSQSIQIKVPFDKIYNLQDTDDFSPFHTKSIFINNIEFKIELYLNGQNEDEMGYVQFRIVLHEIPPNINMESIILTVRLCCNEVFTSWKHPQILYQKGDTISWPTNILPLIELKGDTIFGCDMELTQMKYSKQRRFTFGGSHSHDNDDEKHQIFTYRPLATTAKCKFEWEIDEMIMKLFKEAQDGKSYCSIDINNIWCLCCYPNENGFVVLSLKLLRLPPKVRCIEINLRLNTITTANKVPPHQARYEFDYANPESQKWYSELLPTQALFGMDYLVFKGSIEILRVWEDKKGKFVKPDNWIDYGIDTEYEPSMLSPIDDGSLSPITDGQVCLFYVSLLFAYL